MVEVTYMRYLLALILSGMLFLGINGPSMEVHFWRKVINKKEVTKEQKKKEFKLNRIIWAIGTIIIFAVFIITDN